MIGLKKIHKSFDGIKLFKDFNIDFKENKISCILGASGIGKTTVVNILSGLLKPDSGEVYGTESSNFSYIFQEPRLLNWYSIYDNLDFVLKNKLPEKEKRQTIEQYLKIVDLWNVRNKKPKTLSGGMAQRVSIARAFAYPSNILIMDEPFKGLDIKLKNELMHSFFKLWNNDKRTVIFITHDIDEALKLAKQIFIINNQPAKIVGDFTVSPDNHEIIKNKILQLI